MRTFDASIQMAGHAMRYHESYESSDRFGEAVAEAVIMMLRSQSWHNGKHEVWICDETEFERWSSTFEDTLQAPFNYISSTMSLR